ncbi:MAG: SemiSWEET transporter [Gammaproteobacteria bacterium]|nr:SemiSWEET transporter [Gammaproteobacteria bacterium]
MDATWFGFAAATLTTVSFLPQVWRTLRTRDTKSISLWMYALFTLGVLCWLVYGIYLQDLPMMLANGATGIMASLVLGLKIKHG